MIKKYSFLSVILISLIGCVSVADIDDEVVVEKDTTLQGSLFIKKTGQRGSLIDFDDGYYEKGVESNYSRRGDILVDNITGLEWQDSNKSGNITKPWVTQENYDIGDYNNTSGDTATTYCQNLSLNGGGWRLPTIKELKDVMYDDKRLYNVFNTKISFLGYWSSSSYIQDSNLSWTMCYKLNIEAKNENHLVRCVRDINRNISNKVEFSRDGDIVIDNSTGLYWQDNLTDEKMKWREAIDYCQDLSLGGYDDWSLPNQNELFSIVDYSKYSPSIDSIFQNSKSYLYWTSSRNMDVTLSDLVGYKSNYDSFHNIIVYIDFREGLIYYINHNNDKYVRCVRSD